MTNKYFYETNRKILELIAKNAPTDDQLITIPNSISAVDPFLLSLLRRNPDFAHRGFQLLTFLQSINTLLSRVIASHSYLIQHQNDALSTDLSQPEIDSIVYYQSIIILEYQSSLIVFFLKLRLVIDEIIRLFTINKCDCIGAYFNYKKNNNNCWDFFHTHEPFLASLNATANFIKHNEYLFDNLQILGETPCIYILIKNKSLSKFDYENIKKYFIGQFEDVNEVELRFSISFGYIIKEFNALKSMLEKLP